MQVDSIGKPEKLPSSFRKRLGVCLRFLFAPEGETPLDIKLMREANFELAEENHALLIALADSICSPKGELPPTAEPFASKLRFDEAEGRYFLKFKEIKVNQP